MVLFITIYVSVEVIDTAKTKSYMVTKNEIFALFNQAPSIERGYVVEQAILNGWLKYDDDTINTIGAYIYL